MMKRDLLKHRAEQQKADAEKWRKPTPMESGEDWICEYWKSIYDDFKEAYDFWRAKYDEEGCTVPHDPACTYINSKIIELTQEMNLTKHLKILARST